MMPNDLRRDVQLFGLGNASYNLKRRGYLVTPVRDDPHTDLVVDGQLRVKVKSALFTAHQHSTGRYQFNTKQNPDVYVLVCVGSRGHCFVIPGSIIRGCANVAIWHRDPLEYRGMWRPYLDCWAIIEEELAKCPRLPVTSLHGKTPT